MLVCLPAWPCPQGFVAFNILVFDEELSAVEARVAAMARAGVDAVIVQVPVCAHANACIRMRECARARAYTCVHARANVDAVVVQVRASKCMRLCARARA